MQLSIKNVDERIFREFKAKTVHEGIRVGDAITRAMELWVERKEKKLRFLDLKPTDWGEGTEHTSEEIDEILYNR